MALRLDVFKERRVVPVTFERAKTGAPDATKPDIDSRGSISPEWSHITSVMQGDTITVRLKRNQIDSAAKIYVVSANKGFVKVKTPATGEVPAGATADIEIEGVSGGNPNETKIEVRFGSDKGPIIGALTVRCFSQLTVQVTPHLVTIAQTGGGAAAQTSTASVAAVLAVAQQIWRPHGVVLNAQATQNENVTFATAGIVSDNPFPGELSTLVNTNWIANTINVYFVPQIGTGSVLGYGFSRTSFGTFGLPNPGILLGDKAGAWVHDTDWAGNDLAHEIGHFFGLWHVDNKNPPGAIREDYWARRNLMHNNNVQGQMGDWRDDVDYGTLSGFSRRGGLVTHRALSTIQVDGEVPTARATIVAGPY